MVPKQHYNDLIHEDPEEEKMELQNVPKRDQKNNFQSKFELHVWKTFYNQRLPCQVGVYLSDTWTTDIPVKEEQNWQHGLVNVAVAVADTLI